MKLIVDGREAYAYTGGKPFDPALPCVVFIHGALHDHSAWTLLARWFAHHGHGVLAVDLPGHVRSAGPLLPSIEAAADWILQLLDAAGVRQAALVGHSMGSMIALEAAARAPQRVRALAMVGTAYPMKVSDVLLAGARERPVETTSLVTALSHSTLAAKPSYPGPGSWLRGGDRALLRRVHARHTEANVFEHDYRLCNDYGNGLQAAARVDSPVTLVLGERDQMTQPRAAADLARALKASVVMLPAGHALMQEQPDGVLKALRAALGA